MRRPGTLPKVLVLSRQPLRKRPLQTWLDDTANSVVLVTTPEAVAESEDVLAEHFPEHRLVEDYHSWSAERIAERVAREHGVDLVASTSEEDVLRAARLRARLGIPGQKSASAIAYRDKVVMKELARAAHLPVPAFAPVDGPLDLIDFVDAHGFPVVVKPRLGAGASGVSIVRNADDLDVFLAAQPRADTPYLPGQWMVEAFVCGDFCHVDGIMVDGRVVHSWPSRYNTGVHEHLRDQSCLSSVLLSAEDPVLEALTGLTADVVAAFPPAPLPVAFHLEAWVDGDGRAVLCEIASRAGGALIAETYEQAFGVHLAREGLRGQCGSELRLTGQPAAPASAWGWLLIPPGHGALVAPLDPCPVPGVTFTMSMKAGAIGHGLTYVGESVAGAIISAPTAREVRDRVDEVVRWWAGAAAWLPEDGAVSRNEIAPGAELR